MSLLIEHPETGDTYFIGDLDEGQALARVDRVVFTGEVIALNGKPAFFVHLNDSEDPDDTAEWGNGATQEEAWRYALGALFGPMDSEYDEDSLRTALSETHEGSEP
jgi:hypothetical protein